ncbi:alpha-rhamnosidase [Sinomicrobium kalidii]|uniref:alpha-L-rhamnosidase-related protein n=1 Tax=Sinomicrobium kalidii TaxID=2900738 RepID=UPI001E65AB4C|nr:trehalase family glycosidase [Sinomicrobium kalidii]UGU15748.1 alpha-rhamnosidase [Sinomicrobium kalidii]
MTNKKTYILLILMILPIISQLPQAHARENHPGPTWIWYPGDYEIWLSNKMQARRTERGAFFPPLWRYYSPYALVTFNKEFSVPETDTVMIRAEGECKIQLDGKMYSGDPEKMTIPPGEHSITIKVYNQEKTPALFVEGQYLKSDPSWKVTFEDKEWIDESGRASGQSGTEWQQVGSWDFNTAETLPSGFRLATQPQYTVAVQEEGAGFIADFGKETFGYMRLHGLKGKGKVKLYYGESEEEARSAEACETLDEVGFNGKQPEVYTLKNSKAFRYVQVRTEGGIELDSVSMQYEYLPLEYRGEFQSSDDLLNKIWDVSAYTMHLTTREFFIDGIKRDRWIWSGDAYQSYLMNYYLFFDNPSVKRTLFALRGKDPVNSHINTIMDYSFYWFLGVYDYYRYSGDKAFIRQVYPRMVSLMDFCLERRNDNNMMEGLPGDWVFIDWADGLSKKGEVSFEQLLLARSLETMSLCAGIMDDADASSRYKKLAAELKDDIFRAFWSEEKQAFLHNRVDGKTTDKITRYTNMFAIFFGYLDEQQEQGVKQNVLLNDEVQQITTPYMRFYELEALCEMGEQEYVLDEIRDYWGGMLELGATSFWEKYDPQEKGADQLAMYGRPFGKSLCHAWGASPVYLFGKYYLGVKPTSPGYATYEVRPELGGLKWMEGKVPAPEGEITVYCSRNEIRVTGAGGKGTLVFKSRNVPECRGAKPVKTGDHIYQLTIAPGKTYRVKYKHLK